MCYNGLTAQHSTAQHSTAQHSTAQHSTNSIGLLFQRFKHPFNLLLSQLLSNSKLNKNSSVIKVKTVNKFSLKSLVNSIRVSNELTFSSTLDSTSVSIPNPILNTKAHNRLLKTLLIGMCLITCLTINSVNAALSATTANTIKGTKPYLTMTDGTMLTNLNQLLGFSMWDGTYESDGTTKHMVEINATQSATISMPSAAKFSDIVALVATNGVAQSIQSIVLQDDGDGDTGTPLGTITATWYNNGVKITNLNQTLSVCGGPYTLVIKADNVSANTTYGDPNVNSYGNGGPITYRFQPSGMRICYIQPKSMRVHSGTAGYDIKFANGYNSDIWVYDSVTNKHKGFSVVLMDQAKSNGNIPDIFPTTGFKDATFSLIGSGNDQRVYRCKVINGAGKVSLSGASTLTLGENCTVKYIAETKADFINGGTPIIQMEYYNGSTWSWVLIDSYTIPVPSKWAIGGTPIFYGDTDDLATSTEFYALDYCRGLKGENTAPIGGNPTDVIHATSVPPYFGTDYSAWRQKYMYRRDELTNSPRADSSIYAENTALRPIPANYFSRDIGTFMDEWGYVWFVYTGSPWQGANRYWTAEIWSANAQFYVGSSGYVHYFLPNFEAAGAICRGEN